MIASDSDIILRRLDDEPQTYPGPVLTVGRHSHGRVAVPASGGQSSVILMVELRP